jgi:hypothetical protein
VVFKDRNSLKIKKSCEIFSTFTKEGREKNWDCSRGLFKDSQLYDLKNKFLAQFFSLPSFVKVLKISQLFFIFREFLSLKTT